MTAITVLQDVQEVITHCRGWSFIGASGSVAAALCPLSSPVMGFTALGAAFAVLTKNISIADSHPCTGLRTFAYQKADRKQPKFLLGPVPTSAIASICHFRITKELFWMLINAYTCCCTETR